MANPTKGYYLYKQTEQFLFLLPLFNLYLGKEFSALMLSHIIFPIMNRADHILILTLTPWTRS